ncbi:ORF6N domain-containing protein [bacterium]|nr:ORF6N domain-containing protein [bacterium]
MKNEITILNEQDIRNKIYTIRGMQVMLDEDLAKLYSVETGRLNEQVKRNIKRFPVIFMFQLTKDEYDNLISQIAISSLKHGGRRKLPYAFTEQGVSMLSAVLKSETAIEISVKIINTFVQIRKFITNNANIFQRLNNIEQKQIASDIKQIKTDNKIDAILDAIEAKDLKPKQGIFFDGQIFDAYVFVVDLIKKTKKSIILIDNYIDETVLMMLSKRKKNCKAVIYTQKISDQTKLDLEKHNAQYPEIQITEYKKAHDRFLILDKKEVYHIGASLKDLGRKWFAFSLIKIEANELINKLKKN